MSVPKIPIIWAPDELKFLHDNYKSLTLLQLLNHINSNRSSRIDIGALRHQCYRMRLQKYTIIHWHEDDIEYLIDNYKTKGNKEIAIDLNKLQRTSRVINGQITHRQFSKKSVEKKLKLLKLKRSSEEVFAIRKRNIAEGLTVCQKHDDNYWTKGIRKKATEEEVRIWHDQTGRLRRWIKIGNHFIPYSRWFYNNFINPVPFGFNVFHADFDSLNDDPQNLILRKRRGMTIEEMNEGIKLLNYREKNILNKIGKSKSRNEEKEFMSELIRIRNAMRLLRRKLIKDNTFINQVRNIRETPRPTCEGRPAF
jgi:hypothetical protein